MQIGIVVPWYCLQSCLIFICQDAGAGVVICAGYVRLALLCGADRVIILKDRVIILCNETLVSGSVVRKIVLDWY